MGAGIKIARRNNNNLRYADDTTLMAESKEEVKSLLMRVKESEKVSLKLDIKKPRSCIWPHYFMANKGGGKVKEESEKAGLNLNIQKTKIMASGPISSWQIDGETVETVSDFIFWAPKSLQMATAAKIGRAHV